MWNPTRLTYALRRHLNRWFWRPLQQFASVVHPLPIVAGLLILLLLWQVGQMHEIYVTHFEQADWMARRAHLVLAVAGLMAVSAALFYVNHLLSTIRIDVIYAQSGDYANERRLRVWRIVAGWLVASLPWLGVALGLRSAAIRLEANVHLLKSAYGELPRLKASVDPVLATLLGTPTRLKLAGGIALIAGLVWVSLLFATRQQSKTRNAIILATAVFVAIVLAVPHIHEPIATRWSALDVVAFDLVAYGREVGPLATLLAVVVVLVAVLAVVAYLSGQVGFPLIPLVLAATLLTAYMHWPLDFLFKGMLVLFGFLFVAGLITRRWALGILSLGLVVALSVQMRSTTPTGGAAERLASTMASAPPTLDLAFQNWVAERADDIAKFKAAGRPYPVFVVAAQGGGIYAASAAAAFLSSLQDRCASFARHVFVISAVSGGAVGASVFQTALGDQAMAAPCAARGDAQPVPGTLQRRMARVMRDDHFSPLLGMMLLDLAGLANDRAAALERSFARSVRESGKIGNLDLPFDRHWTAKGSAPALMLNATWVETGYRVAYAPFTLNGMRDKTLYAFSDPAMAFALQADITLAQAAITSARFPGVLPAYVRESKDKQKRWNFVDGAYADNSGAASALEVYKHLQVRAGNDGLDLRLILLTNARPEEDFDRISGVAARDVLVPALAVLRVRDLLSQQAVLRAVSEIDPAGPELAKVGYARGWKTAVVELDQGAYSLPLSWEISQATHTIVSINVASPGLCQGRREVRDRNDVAADAGLAQVSAASIHANSCVAEAILKLLDPTQPLD